jgi:hypothetical protein
MITTTTERMAGLIGVFFLLAIAGCNLPGRTAVATPDATGVYLTAAAIMTEKAGTLNPLPTQPAATPLPEVITPTVGRSPAAFTTGSTLQNSPSVPCDLAKPGLPLDVTIPDDSRLQPGESFTKIWRLANAGSCAWTRDYSVVWFSGDALGVESEHRLAQSVAPGESIEIAVDMVAPGTPGVYASYWMLRSDRGSLFGLGPNGDAPFWARIQVVVVSTATPMPTAIPSPTPVIEVSGKVSLQPGQVFDLDTGLIEQNDGGDVMLEENEPDQYQLFPLNGARLVAFGLNRPGISDCNGAQLTGDPVRLGDQQAGVYLCYRTNQGLSGTLLLVKLPAQGVPLEMEYVTWASP